MIEFVAMLRPRAVPVAESGTHFVMVLLVMVFRRVVATVMGTRVRARRTTWLAKACVCWCVCVCVCVCACVYVCVCVRVCVHEGEEGGERIMIKP